MQPMRTPLVALLAGSLAACASAPTPQTPAVVPPHVGAVAVEVPDISHPGGETAAWWFRDGAAQAANRGSGQGRARNLILFVGDGMSLPTVAAARILDGQRKGRPGEGNRLAWEHFPQTAFSRTYNTDSQTPDSAGTMSAMATGVKTRAGVISIGQAPRRGDCAGALDAGMLTLWELAESAGMATGVVTTARATHATPAATFSHAADRNWENDSQLPDAAKAAGCTDIARQMIETPYGDGPDVLLGGGRTNFMPAAMPDPEYPGKAGRREDGRDLVAEWLARHPGGSYAWNAAQFAAAPADAPLLGLFEPSHMHYEHDRAGDAAGEPSLADMTRAAIERLSRDADGYVLLVEGARIDHAHHDGNAFRALDETIALSEAVAVADAMTSADDTLVLVTADHAHTMSFVGYPVRGNPILGKVMEEGRDGAPEPALDENGLPYTTLVYANGPGYVGAEGRPDLAAVDTAEPDYRQEAIVPLGAESHGGDDVGIWARGPDAAAVRGSVEQNAIFHFLLQASPRLRKAMCDNGYCDANGIPTGLPDPAAFRAASPAPATR